MRIANVLIAALATLIATIPAHAAGTPAGELTGLWKAKKYFGPDARGTLTVERTGTTYTAEMVGHVVPMRIENGELAFSLPDDQGTFRGKLEGGAIRGHWLRPPSPVNGSRYASGVLLETAGPNRWRGVVVPNEDTSRTAAESTTLRAQAMKATSIRAARIPAATPIVRRRRATTAGRRARSTKPTSAAPAWRN